VFFATAPLARRRHEFLAPATSGSAALECAKDARRDPRRMPVHSHDGTERLEPEWARKAREEFVTSIILDDRLSDDSPEPGHAVAKPPGDFPSMQRWI
jgi:hypothetical protein